MTGPRHHPALQAALTLALAAAPAAAFVIDNDIPFGTVGHFSVDLRIGGETGFGNSVDVRLTADRLVSGIGSDPDLVYDYYSYVNTGGNSLRLSGGVSAQATPAGNDAGASTGSFTGSAGNTIDWAVTSFIPDLSDAMTSVFTFTARTGTLGTIDFYQYLDEDIEFFSNDDVFFTRGSADRGDLLLFTFDNTEAYGISHGGAYSDAQGLVNSSFLGWAMDEYNHFEAPLFFGTLPVSPTGVIDAGNNSDLPLFEHPQIGPAYGPEDIVSALVWRVDPNQQTATIITSLGGVPSVQDIPEETNLPEPATALLIACMAVPLLTRRRKA